jgi:4,5-dihydroxyphthalate decarboxylase
MSQEQKPIRVAISDNLWTRALVDGSVRVDGFPVEFHSKVTLPDRLHGVREGKWDGSDGTLTDYLLEKDAGLGVPKVALPIFMLGGFRQRTLLMRRGGLSVNDLRGRRVLMPRVLTPGAVYVRGLLADEFGIERDAVQWHTIHGAKEDATWQWLTGRLDKPEGFEAVVASAAMLSGGKFDALIHPGGHGFRSLFGGDDMIGGTLKRFPDLYEPLGDVKTIAAWFRKTRIYPIVHALQLSEDCLAANPGLSAAMIGAFSRGWSASEAQLGPQEKEFIDRERELLGFDPYRYELGEVQRRTIEKLMDYLQVDGLLKRRFSIEELFPSAEET